jgi:hypothetical protein
MTFDREFIVVIHMTEKPKTANGLSVWASREEPAVLEASEIGILGRGGITIPAVSSDLILP